MFNLSPSFLTIIAALVITSLGGYFINSALKSARTAGLEQGRKECAEKQNRAIQDEKKRRIERKKEVIKLSDDDLRKRYCYWVRDIPYDECVRTVVFVD